MKSGGIMEDKKYLVDNKKLMKEWNWSRNKFLNLDPGILTLGSNKKAWWKCEKGHEWQTSVYNRTRTNCPYCSGRRVIEGENDLKTVHPELIEEWDFEKNKGVDPSKIMSSIALKVWWKCEKGHEWLASINNRSKGKGCPVCASEIQTSFPEKALYYYLNKILNVESRKKILGQEIDIYIESLDLGIEYDGIYYHERERKKFLDKQKNNVMKSEGICLLRVKESDREYYDIQNKIFYYIPNSQYTNLNIVIENMINLINNTYNLSYKVDVDIKRDSIEILKTYKSLEISNSLGEKNLELSSEWNYEKNGKLVPEQFTSKSQFKVWWKCKNGHEWQAKISDRSKGKGCPICAGRQVLKGFNDLATRFPALIEEWNFEKNIITPDDVVAFSDKKVWWKCKRGHEWEAIISSRSRGNTGCPFCSGNKVVQGVTDFATWCKENNREILLKEFDENKNNFDISELFPKGDVEVWWICPKGHSYSTKIKSRTRNNTGCPYCAHKTVLKGYSDLATTHPNIAKEWDYKKNEGVTPFDVMAGSNNKKYWFKCSKGHSYSSSLLNRKKGRGCPYCRGRKNDKTQNSDDFGL